MSAVDLIKESIASESVQWVQQLFEKQAYSTPDLIALQWGKQHLTYKQLQQEAAGVAKNIASKTNASARIGLSASRNSTMVSGLWGILQSGNAYVPLDPGYPKQRLLQIIADANLEYCVASPSEKEFFESLGLAIIASDSSIIESEQEKIERSEVAYILHTSGSTGKPKGVCMGHKPLVNLIQWQNENSQAAAGDYTLQFAPLSFDVSFQEIAATLSTGGTLVLIEDELRLDFSRLLYFIEANNVKRIFLPFVALQYLAEFAVSEQHYPACLREIMTAGEQLKITPQLTQFLSALPTCTLYNQYGPTECHVVTQLRLAGNPGDWPSLPSIGRPIAGTSIFLLSSELELLPAGEIGELCIGGVCLAEGYLHQPDLTAERFITWQHPEQGPMRLYRTGDLARYLPDGNLEFLGRQDDQVKIRGHRVELGEVEVAINAIAGIKQSVVTAADIAGQKQLVAYLVASDAQLNAAVVKAKLEKSLPEYMVPRHYTWLPDLPKTNSGKVDKKLLPAPDLHRPELSTLYKKPVTLVEKNLAAVWAELLAIDTVGVNDNFFELGGGSLLALKTAVELRNRFGYAVPVTKLYQFPTVAQLALVITGKLVVQEKSANHVDNNPAGAIAIIGMAGRWPGANTIDEYWSLLNQGKEKIRFFNDNELDASIAGSVKKDAAYVKARGILDKPEYFDAAFFGLSPKAAEVMDPQQRIFLEIAWEALESAGYAPPIYTGSVGVYAGCGNNSYYLNNILPNRELVEQLGGFQVMALNEKDYISSRTAFQLNLKGPAVSVYSACSTSLLAIAQAVEGLRSGKCTVALAGGASVTVPINSGHLYQEGAMLSRDGHCRPFDADAQGTVFSDGAGVVLLKPLEAAQRDGDPIYAVIKGVGINNDGGGKGSFTAPSAEGQAGAIRMALQDAQVEPATIGYLEAHGTATPLGDPIEIEGLTMAFGEQARTQFCALGSVKGNLGHLTAAAGVAGLIKTVLALHHKQLPPSINFERPNPNINFTQSPFFVNTQLREWSTTEVRRAGVSSFGVGGTNVHVVLEEFESPTRVPASGRATQLLTWSAKSGGSREAYAGRLAEHLQQHQPELADVAYTLQTTRPAFQHRRFAVASTSAELQQKLAASAASEAQTLQAAPDEVVFLFPGQGAQYLHMGHGLYEQEAVYRHAVDECAELLQEYLGEDIRTILYPAEATADAEEKLKNTFYTQPALFVTEYALARLWTSWGIQPSVFCGHSIGEFVAAHLAGVFSLADALRLIATRGRLVSGLPGGSMLSVRMRAEELLDVLPTALSIAAINGPTACVVAGPDAEVAAFAHLLEQRNVPCRPLATSHAFHSSLMDPIVGAFEKEVQKVALQRPQKPIVSTVSGTWLTDAQATDPGYWANHLRATVQFSAALSTLFEQDTLLLLEVGPGTVTSALARQQAGSRPVATVASLNLRHGDETSALLHALGQLWLHGLEPDWPAFYAGQNRSRILLPTYAFDKKRHWVDPVAQLPSFALNSPLAPVPPADITLERRLPVPLMRKTTLLEKVKAILEDASGIEMEGATPDMSFLELGLDSLLLTQVALTLKREFGLPITFRQLNEQYATLGQLTTYLDSALPAEPAPAALPASAPAAVPSVAFVDYSTPAPASDSALGLIAQQLQILSKQVALLQDGPAVPASAPVAAPAAPRQSLLPTAADLTPDEALEIKKPFGATARIERQTTGLSARQQEFLAQLTQRYNHKTQGSKAHTQQHRAHMADPRVVSGFRPLTKEAVYPIVVQKSKGSRLWDVDGNEYIDALNGFGSSMFGYQPDFIKQALHQQIEAGYEIGPQHVLAGTVSKLVCECTGHDRAALCSTGSEAVLGAMRMARTVTGRSLIVAFSGSYHGIADEVLVRGTKKLKSFPAAPGIMPEAVQNMLILDYGTDESLRIIAERAEELAAVLVEPVQSRRPEFVPVAFLKQVRNITAAAGAALIFDEVITGFRMHLGGAQALFGIQADLATYGKVVGGGLPIGVIAGRQNFMNALDGGFWQYGDASMPEAGVTYFAGTFVRHPLALATAEASLRYMKARGAELQQSLTAKAERLATALNAEFERLCLPMYVAQFGSLWKIKFREEIPYAELLFLLLRDKGIHIWDGFPCFMTEAHTLEEVDLLVQHCISSVHELLQAGFYPATAAPAPALAVAAPAGLNQPPAPGARLGRDQTGNPAWFVADPSTPGTYLQVSSN